MFLSQLILVVISYEIYETATSESFLTYDNVKVH